MKNVKESDLKSYIETFNASLKATAKKCISEEHHKKLVHLSLLPAKITGYVSTQFGIAIEYNPANRSSIQIVRGSSRIEDLFLNTPNFLKKSKSTVLSIKGNVNMIGCSVSGMHPFRLYNEDSSVSFENAYFSANEWEKKVHYAEVFGNRLRENWTPEKAIIRAKDEALAALVEIQKAERKKITIPEYVHTFKEKTVLVLGDYDIEGEKRLLKICNVLKEQGYEPILIKDVPDYPHEDIRQKVVAISAISRFIVIDDSSKSGHILEVQLCDQNKWVTILLRARGKGGSWMTAGYDIQSKVIKEVTYDPTNPKRPLIEATNWAEKKLKDLRKKFDNLYPWRGLKS